MVKGLFINRDIMRRTYTSVVLALLMCSLFACQKGGTSNSGIQSAPIVGKWNLQQQKIVQYIDGVKQVDTSVMASSTNFGHLKFNNDGTFNSASFSISITGIGGLGSGNSNMTSQDSTYGTYTYVKGSIFDISAPIAGLNYGVSAVFNTTTAVPIFTLVSKSSQINQLTTTNLNIHTEYIYTGTTTTDSKTYKSEQDFYYVK